MLGKPVQPPQPDPKIVAVVTDRNVGDTHYAAIGRVAAGWAYFEAVIDTWLHQFAGLRPEVGVCFTGQMIGPGPRINAFIALVLHLGAHDRWVKPLNQFAERARLLGDKRNRA